MTSMSLRDAILPSVDLLAHPASCLASHRGPTIIYARLLRQQSLGCHDFFNVSAIAKVIACQSSCLTCQATCREAGTKEQTLDLGRRGGPNGHAYFLLLFLLVGVIFGRPSPVDRIGKSGLQRQIMVLFRARCIGGPRRPGVLLVEWRQNQVPPGGIRR